MSLIQLGTDIRVICDVASLQLVYTSLHYSNIHKNIIILITGAGVIHYNE